MLTIAFLLNCEGVDQAKCTSYKNWLNMAFWVESASIKTKADKSVCLNGRPASIDSTIDYGVAMDVVHCQVMD